MEQEIIQRINEQEERLYNLELKKARVYKDPTYNFVRQVLMSHNYALEVLPRGLSFLVLQ
jgi:hypothetical protein